MSRPTVPQAEAWRPDALRELADAWDESAVALRDRLLALADASGHMSWSGAAADAARREAAALVAAGNAVLRSSTLATVAARDGATQIADAQADVLARVAAAREDGYGVADDGTVTPPAEPVPLLVALSGGAAPVAKDMLALHAVELTRQLSDALEQLGAVDVDAARDVDEAFMPAAVGAAPATVPAGAWPLRSQDRIADQIAAMTPEQRQRLIDEFPRQVGDTDGVPWEMRFAANRTNIAQAIVAERGTDPAARQRIGLYRSLLGEVDDPGRSGRRVDRQILAFDPERAMLVELIGDLATAGSVGVLVPGLNTTMEGSAATTQTARRFVSATRGDVAMITYLGGPFPHGNPVTGLVDAANPRYALDMAPRLVTFSHDVDRAVAATGRDVPVTYVGHSYGGSIIGTAEVLGLTGDRMLYVAAAGAGVGVDEPGDWHNPNPHVLRFSMTAPGDFIEAVQGFPGGPHGADPDQMPGVIRLATGHYDDGRLMAGWPAHSDVLNWPSDAWRNVLAVITGDSATLHKAG